jgi:hypothetical protein
MEKEVTEFNIEEPDNWLTIRRQEMRQEHKSIYTPEEKKAKNKAVLTGVYEAITGKTMTDADYADYLLWFADTPKEKKMRENGITPPSRNIKDWIDMKHES